jgi:hypothetical protein
MAQVMIQIASERIVAQYDCSTNPLILLLMAEQDEAECDATESTWLAGQAVTQPKQSD